MINVITKRAQDFSGLRVVGELDASAPSTRNNSPNASFVNDLGRGYRLAVGFGREFSVGGKPSEFTIELDYYKNQGPRWQLGPQPYGDDYVTGLPKNFGLRGTAGIWGGRIRNADYIEVPAAYLRFVRGEFQVAVRASAFRRGTVFPDSLAAAAGDFDEPWNREVDRFLNVDMSQHFTLSARTEFVARAYADLYDYHWYNRSSAAEDCPDGFLTGCDRTLYGVGRSLGAELRTQVQWPVLRASTLVGVDARLRQVHDELRIESSVGPQVSPEGSRRTDGIVAPYIAQTFSPTRWLDVNLGLRLDHDTRFGQKLSPRSALGVTPWPGGRLKLVYSGAFRAPSAYELSYREPNSQVAPTGLGPESERSVEASIEQRFGKHRLLFGLFRSWWGGLVGASLLTQPELDAAIASAELAPGVIYAYRRSNLAHIDNFGMNASYEGAALNARLHFGINFAAAITRVDPGEGTGFRVLQVAPQSFGNARASYQLPGAWPALSLALRFMDRRLANRFHDGGFSPPPSVPELWALRGAVTGRLPAIPGLNYRVGAEYSFTKVEPYVIGAAQYATASVTSAELAPTRRAQAFVGLEYAFEH